MTCPALESRDKPSILNKGHETQTGSSSEAQRSQCHPEKPHLFEPHNPWEAKPFSPD